MSSTLNGITGQFDYWDKATYPAPLALDGSIKVLLGCGTSYNLAWAAASALCRAGHSAIAVPAGEWLERPDAYLPQDAKADIIAFSRSGETTETVRAAAASRARGLSVLSISCAPQSPLEAASDRCHVFDTHPDEGIVITCSASLMLNAGYAMAGLPIDAAVMTEAKTLLAAMQNADTSSLHARSHWVYLGGGPHYGVMLEGALKLMEMAISVTQAFHPGEYRHGPISLIDEGSAVVMLYHSETYDQDKVLVREIQEKGALVLGLGGPGNVSFPIELTGDVAGAAVLPALQLLGERHAQSKGLDTTAPRHLTKVVKLR